MNKKTLGAVAVMTLALFFPVASFAHEVYVLPWEEVEVGLRDTTVNPFAALLDPGNVKTAIIISIGISAALIIAFVLQRTRFFRSVAQKLEKLHPIGLLLVRVAVAASLISSAYHNSFFGPEIPLSIFPYPALIQAILYGLGGLLLVGLFTEVAAVLALCVFLLAVFKLHSYMLIYFTYVGELVALAMFGSRYFSLDKLFFGFKKAWARFQKYEVVIVRVAYGFGLVYAAVTVKFMHAILTLDVVRDYNLTQFYLLFPHDPLLVVLGAGLSEITIGLFIIFGFEMRLTVLVSLFYITLSLLFFRELVWPHYILYGISFYLLFAPSSYNLDSWLHKKIGYTKSI